MPPRINHSPKTRQIYWVSKLSIFLYLWMCLYLQFLPRNFALNYFFESKSKFLGKNWILGPKFVNSFMFFGNPTFKAFDLQSGNSNLNYWSNPSEQISWSKYKEKIQPTIGHWRKLGQCGQGTGRINHFRISRQWIEYDRCSESCLF